MKGQLDSAFAAWAPFVSFARLRALARVLSGVSGAAWSGWPGRVPEPRRKLAAALLSLMSAGAFSHMPLRTSLLFLVLGVFLWDVVSDLQVSSASVEAINVDSFPSFYVGCIAKTDFSPFEALVFLEQIRRRPSSVGST